MVPVVSWRIFSEYQIPGPITHPVEIGLFDIPHLTCLPHPWWQPWQNYTWLSNNAVILNQIGLLIVTQDNGTLLDPTSFREEDAIEVCVGLGQEHPEGVLQISDTETVLAFSSCSCMLAALQHFAVAMTWHHQATLALYLVPHDYAGKGLHCWHKQSPLWHSSTSLGWGGRDPTFP